MCPVRFHPAALAAIREFPREIRDRLGKALYLLQTGERLLMPLSRRMPSIGTGVAEIRLHDQSGQFRTIYCAIGKQGVVVFHAFMKKSRKTPLAEIRLAKTRWKEMMDE